MTRTILHTLIVGTALLAGCASAPTTSSHSPLDAAAKKFQPQPGKASLYIIRVGDVAGSPATLQMMLDGRIAGPLTTGTYQWISVDPGEHELMLNIASGEQELMVPGRFKNQSQVKFNAQPDQNYFFRASLHLGWGQASLNLAPNVSGEGRKDVMASKLAAAPAN